MEDVGTLSVSPRVRKNQKERGSLEDRNISLQTVPKKELKEMSESLIPTSFSCPKGYFDRRDFSLAEALKKLAQEVGTNITFGTLDYDQEPILDPEELKKECQGDGFLKGYKVSLVNSLTCQGECEEKASQKILIPLKYKALKLEVVDGRLILTEKTGGKTVEKAHLGTQALYQNSIPKIFYHLANSDHPLEPMQSAEFFIQPDGTLALRPVEHEVVVCFGQGFTKYEINPVYWPSVEDQGASLMCTANAGVALLEYFERFASGRHVDASRLFLHKVASKWMNQRSDAGVSIRAVVAAMSIFGVPPESCWPYDLQKLDQEPSEYCYAYARHYRAACYLRLDRPELSKAALVTQIKVFIYTNLPVIFGLSVYDSIYQSDNLDETNDDERLNRLFGETISAVKGGIPYPTSAQMYRGGHAIVSVGYDDNKIIVNSSSLTQRDRDKYFPQQESAKLPILLVTKNPNEGKKIRFRMAQNNQDNYTYTFQSDSTWMECEDANFKSCLFNNPKTDQQLWEGGTFLLLIPKDADQSLEDNSVMVSADLNSDSNIPVFEYLATLGAFKIRNSWGAKWGEKGYGWLPYTYVYGDLTFDWWSILKFEWLNTDDLGLKIANDVGQLCRAVCL